MKLKYFVRIISVILISMFLICSICTVQAANGLDINAFENSGNVADVGKVTNLVKSTSDMVVSVIRIVGVSIAVIMLLVIAMKYMLSAPGDRADIKKHAVAYVIGAFILFGVTGILSALVELANEIKNNQG